VVNLRLLNDNIGTFGSFANRSVFLDIIDNIRIGAIAVLKRVSWIFSRPLGSDAPLLLVMTLFPKTCMITRHCLAPRPITVRQYLR